MEHSKKRDQEKVRPEDFFLRFTKKMEEEKKERQERKRKKWEAFWKLSPQEKIDQLWADIWELGEKLDNHFQGDEFLEDEMYAKFTNIDERFKAVYSLLGSLGARDEELANLVSLSSFSPTNFKCPSCRRQTVIRKGFRLECFSDDCDWSKDIEY